MDTAHHLLSELHLHVPIVTAIGLTLAAILASNAVLRRSPSAAALALSCALYGMTPYLSAIL